MSEINIVHDDNKVPMVSVIMGVYNCEATVGEAIDSILGQSFQDFEFIICDDGSTDRTLNIIKNYEAKCPEKIIILQNDKNRGLNYTLNHCLQYSKGKYIARMDGDDLSLPNRFEREVLFLEDNPHITIVGATLRVFDDSGVWGRHSFITYPTKKDFMKASPFSHSVCMVRREAYTAVGGYSDGKRLMRVEDYHLWVKMYNKGYMGANLTDELYLYRDDRNAYKKRKFKYRINEAYVRACAVKMLHLPKWNYIFSVKPILIGILPYRLYNYFHRKSMDISGKGN